jgi:hypothetical protein
MSFSASTHAIDDEMHGGSDRGENEKTPGPDQQAALRVSHLHLGIIGHHREVK